MFHAVGLNVMDARESKEDILEASRRALRDMIAKVVVEERDQQDVAWHKSRAETENPRRYVHFSLIFSTLRTDIYCRSSENQDCMLYIESYHSTCVEQADCDKHSRSNSASSFCS